MIKTFFHYMSLQFSPTHCTVQRGKGAEEQVRKRKFRQCHHPQRAAESSPLPAPLSWVRKQKSVSASSSATCPWHSQVATQLPCKDLLTNFGLRNMLERIRERWVDGGNGALLIWLSVKVLQILKNFHACVKAKPFLVMRVLTLS